MRELDTAQLRDLTAAEARQRARLVDKVSYEIALDLTGDQKSFLCRAHIRFTAQPGTQTFLDLWAEEVTQLRCNGEELPVSAHFRGRRLYLPPLEAENMVEVVARFAYSKTGEGLARIADPADGEEYVYTQFSPVESRRVFPVFEQPDIKATFTFTVVAPERWTVISNMAPDRRAVAAAAEQQPARRWEFPPTPTISSYVSAVLAGPYHSWHDRTVSSSGRSIPLGVYCRRSMVPCLESSSEVAADSEVGKIFQLTKTALRFFEEKFDYPYPFQKYDQIFCPEYNFSAMENVGCVTFNEAFLSRKPQKQSPNNSSDDAQAEWKQMVMLHEMAHMWFGNLVTMRWWDDLWLKESFAEWAAHYALDAVTDGEAWVSFCIAQKSRALIQDQLPTTHPVYTRVDSVSEVYGNFDGITYSKGAAVLRQLVAWVGEENFLDGLRSYFKKYAYGNTELPDLLGELSEACGQDLRGWAEQWLHTVGPNVFELQIDDGKPLLLAQQAGPEVPLRQHRLAVAAYSRGASISRVELSISDALSEVPLSAGSSSSELLLPNSGDLTYAKVRFDPRSRESALQLVGSLPRALDRAVVWLNLWMAVRDGDISPGSYIAAVMRQLKAEKVTILKSLLENMRLALWQYLPEPLRGQLAGAAAEQVWEAFETATAYDIRQLLLSTYAALASGEAQLQRLKNILNEREVVEFSPDMRWELAAQLAAADSLEPAELEWLAAEDQSTRGQEAAAEVRAARPSGKEEAWEALYSAGTLRSGQLTSSLTNSWLRHTALGFSRTRSPELLRGYAERYFAEVGPMFSRRSFHVAKNIATLTFPMLLADQRLLERGRSWQDEEQRRPTAPALRRLMRELLYEADIAVRLQNLGPGNYMLSQ